MVKYDFSVIMGFIIVKSTLESSLNSLMSANLSGP